MGFHSTVLAFICICLFASFVSTIEDEYLKEETRKKVGIINGRTTNVKKHPYIASFIKNGELWGAAAILNNRWVITSGINTPFGFPGNVVLRVGTNHYDEGGQLLTLSSYIVHPKYTGYSWDYDIGLVKVSETIKFNKWTRPIKLARRDPKDNDRATVVGWGQINATDEKSFSNKLRQIGVKVISTASCQALMGNTTITPRLFCATRENVAPCYGDWGDPLIYKKKLIGIYAGQESCRTLQNPQAYVKIASFYDWIQSSIKDSNSSNLF